MHWVFYLFFNQRSYGCYGCFIQEVMLFKYHKVIKHSLKIKNIPTNCLKQKINSKYIQWKAPFLSQVVTNLNKICVREWTLIRFNQLFWGGGKLCIFLEFLSLKIKKKFPLHSFYMTFLGNFVQSILLYYYQTIKSAKRVETNILAE